MSLYVILKSRRVSDGEQNEFERHVPFTFGTMPQLENEEIDYIQADGDELEAIRRHFSYSPKDGSGLVCSIPFCGNRVVRWYGDIAKTIYFNLR